MMRQWFLLVVAGLLLAGCYESQDLLLDPGAARQPFAAGARSLIEDDKTTRFVLTPRSDGWYDVQAVEDGSPGAAHKVLLNDLSKDSGRTLYAYATYDSDEGAYVYGILSVDADGRVMKKDADCHREADEKIAEQMGGAKKLVDSCQFYRNDKGLLAALQALAKNPKHWAAFD
jgi:hypothetical protein